MPVSTRLPDVNGSALYLALAAATALLIGFSVSHEEWLIPIALLGLVAVLLAMQASATLIAGLLGAAALLQIHAVTLGGIPNLTLPELVVPFLLAVLAARALSTSSRQAVGITRAQGLSAAQPIPLAVGFLTLVIALGYLRSIFFTEATAPGTERVFYEYFVALGSYWAAYSLFKSRDVDWQRLLRALLVVSAGLSLAGIVAIALGYPLDLGGFRYTVHNFEDGAVRAGFLGVSGTVGLAIALTTNFRFRGPAVLLFVAALVASGGRGALVGAAVAVAVYLSVTRRSWQVLAVGGVLAATIIAVPSLGSTPQAERFSRVSQQELEDDGRTFLYEESLRQFSGRPLIGTGVGEPASVIDRDPKAANFYNTQLELGGHATYTSILKNFGLAGFLPFAFALGLALVGLLRPSPTEPVAGFLLIVLLAEAVSMWVGGNGSNPLYYFALAGAASVLAGRRARPEGAA